MRGAGDPTPAEAVGGSPSLGADSASAVPQSYEQPIFPGAFASFALHMAVAIALALAPSPQRHESIAEVDVELVTPPAAGVERAPAQSAAPPIPAEAAPAASDRRLASPSEPAPGPSPRAMVKPTQMLSAAVLDKPRSDKARRALSRLAPDERIVQLCNIEAMAQVAAWNASFQPDLVVAGAATDSKPSGNSLVADGAAFHSGRQWFAISFHCDVAPDRKRVVAFEFIVGDPIPNSEWERDNLPVKTGPHD